MLACLTNRRTNSEYLTRDNRCHIKYLCLVHAFVGRRGRVHSSVTAVQALIYGRAPTSPNSNQEDARRCRRDFEIVLCARIREVKSKLWRARCAQYSCAPITLITVLLLLSGVGESFFRRFQCSFSAKLENMNHWPSIKATIETFCPACTPAHSIHELRFSASISVSEIACLERFSI